MTGDRLDKWVISKELGRGGMGRVYLAHEEMGNRVAAIKVLSAELAQESGFLQRFQREIDTLSQLDHPNIVRFFESGCDNGIYYYAMEYVEGQSLEDVLHERGRLPWQEVLDIAIQICPALRHVHDHGIIHRDLKPPNILRTTDGKIKLTDFGIAKVFAGTHLTKTGGVVGTAEFVSPEQAAGKPLTKKSDLYSLGVVLYTLLTGRTTFEGASFLDLLHKHRYARFDPPRRIVPEIPYEIDEVVCQLLEKDPAKRPPDCLVLGRHLNRIRNKLDRKSHQTAHSVPREATVAENAEVEEGGPGPGTIMSKLMRAELERQNRPNFLSRILNRGWLLSLLLAACIGVLVWSFWPLSAETLYERGSTLMQSERRSDWERAWREYFGPLNERYPDHPYDEDLDKFRQQLELSRLAGNLPEPAQLFYEEGERLWRQGNVQEASTVWKNVVNAFAGVESQSRWVERAKKSLVRADEVEQAKIGWEAVQKSLERAAKLELEGKHEEAVKIWTALEKLYANHTFANAIREEIINAKNRIEAVGQP